MRRRMRTRLPTYMSTGFGDLVTRALQASRNHKVVAQHSRVVVGSRSQ